MAYDTRHVVIVNGYGCHLDTPLKPYLDRVVRFINDIPSDVSLQVIFSGGLTQQMTAPGITEANLMAEYVHMHPDRRRMGYLCFKEKSAFTTYGNISGATELVYKWRANTANGVPFKSTKITIFCEATRAAHVVMLARHFLLPFVKNIDDINVETASWERANPFKQVGNLIYNKLAITYPWLGLAERERRHRMQRAKEI